jgi:hypothetical protein
MPARGDRAAGAINGLLADRSTIAGKDARMGEDQDEKDFRKVLSI